MFPVNIKKVETNTFEYSFKNKTFLSLVFAIKLQLRSLSKHLKTIHNLKS